MPEENQEEKSEVVVESGRFFYDSFKSVYVCFIVLLLVNCLLALSVAYKYTRPVVIKYFAASQVGTNVKVLKDQPLFMPLKTQGEVAQWAANSVRRAFSLDFVHWKTQLGEVANTRFTKNGYTDFIKWINDIDLLKTMESLKMVAQAKITAPPQITQVGRLGNGLYSWNVVMAVNVLLLKKGRVIQLPLRLQLLVVRQPFVQFSNGIAINNFLLKRLSNRASRNLI